MPLKRKEKMIEKIESGDRLIRGLCASVSFFSENSLGVLVLSVNGVTLDKRANSQCSCWFFFFFFCCSTLCCGVKIMVSELSVNRVTID